MATAIIALAGSLGLGVVAEGVETERQAQVLHRLGCHVMQGYLFSRALPAEDFERWVSRARIQPGAPWLVMADEPTQRPPEAPAGTHLSPAAPPAEKP